MFPTPLKSFVHPHSVYKLEYPAHWDQVTEKNGESCGFGPHERNDVGLWISILPMSIDSDKVQDELPMILKDGVKASGAENLRRDETLHQYGLIADMTRDGQGGNCWIVAGGDVLLFASTQVPIAERDHWNPLFQKVMSSLLITRDTELLLRQLGMELATRLHEKDPTQEFKFEGDKLRSSNRVIFLSNLLREVRSSPNQREKIIKRFVDALGHPAMEELGYEEWDDACKRIVPILKPLAYIDQDGPTQHFVTREWLADVFICYAIRSKKMFRFVTGWDVNRWDQTAESLHQQALANLVELSWPREILGTGGDDGRIIVLDTEDNLSSSRLLHPDLHKLFSGPLGRTFWAGIPCRDRLVLFSDRRTLKQRIHRRLKKDHDSSAYPITPKPFLVTRDGIAPSVDKK